MVTSLDRVGVAAGREAFFTESVCKTGPNSRFIHRYVEASRGFGFPPDLLPVALKFPQDPRMESTFGLLDMDHFITLDEDFSVESAIDNFFALHEHQTKAFEASVTADALDITPTDSAVFNLFRKLTKTHKAGILLL